MFTEVRHFYINSTTMFNFKVYIEASILNTMGIHSFRWYVAHLITAAEETGKVILHEIIFYFEAIKQQYALIYRIL